MSDRKIVVFIHGSSGPESAENWLNPLNRRLREMGYSHVDGTVDLVIPVTYLDRLLKGFPGRTPPDTWMKPEDRKFVDAEAAYLLRRAELARLVARWRRKPGTWGIPQSVAGFVADQVVEPLRLYRHSPRHRDAAQQRILKQLPQSGSAVVIAYSLGSVVAADLLKKLPRGLIVELLLTVGSPLAIETLGTAGKLDRVFPYDRVRAWVNVFDPRDVATIGRGIAARFPAVLDVPVAIGGSHNVAGYMNHPAVATLVGDGLFGSRGSEVGSHVPVRQLDSAWFPLLLNFAYTAQLAATTEPGQWKLCRRLNTAREELARRAVDEAQKHRDRGPQTPSISDFLHQASDLIRDTWSDPDLVLLAVSLAMCPPLAPFDIDIDPDHRHQALVGVLNRVRRRQGDLTDEAFAAAVRKAVAEAKRVVDEKGFPWGKVLIAGGLAVLALTGAGLAVAATAAAGLAGAAAITTTLVAFGPGGMVGGMVTLAVLTGTGASLAGAGVSLEVALGADRFEALRFEAAEGMARGPLSELRTTVAAMLAVVAVQEELGFASSATTVEEVLLEALAVVNAEYNLHSLIAPDARGTEEWKRKAEVLSRALEWLGPRTGFDAERTKVRQLVEEWTGQERFGGD